jgi:hypothetical protein
MTAQLPPSDQPRSEPPQLARSLETIAELPNIRHSELKSISERLGTVAEVSRSAAWGDRSQLAKGIAGGGAIGFVPFLVENPSTVAVGAYALAVLVAMAAGLIFSSAGKDVQAERSDSITAIKDHIDKYILATETPPRLLGTARRVEPALLPPYGTTPDPPAPSPPAG